MSAIRIAAYGLVVDRGRILLCRLSSQMPSHAGSWTLPGGGLDFGEDPALAMIREVREETGLIVRPSGVAGIDSAVIRDPKGTTHGLRIVYFTEIVGGELTNEVDGTTDLCEWHDVKRVESLPIVTLVRFGLQFVR